VNGCADAIGGYTCTCGAGFTPSGSGLTASCVDVDECAEGLDDCDEDPGALCSNTSGAFTCACPPDFSGSARGASGCVLTNPALSGIGVGAGALLSPTFSSSTLVYQMVLPPGATASTLTPTVSWPDRATISFDGSLIESGGAVGVSVGAGYGPRVVTLVVTTESRATQTYTVAVVRSSHYVKASNTGASDEFGSSVALSADGSTLAVGAPVEDSVATGLDGDSTSNGALNSGAVYVFRRTAGAWAQEAYVKASNTGASDQFGWSVELSADGSALAVGASSEASAATGIGGDPMSNAAVTSGAV
jgi:hypothetical protein